MEDSFNRGIKGSHDWKVISVLIVGAIILVTAFVGSDFDLFGSSTGLFTVFDSTTEKDIPVYLTLDIDKIDLQLPIESLTVQFSAPPEIFTFNENTLDISSLSDQVVKIDNFEGTLEFNTNGLDLEGKSDILFVNGVSLSSKKPSNINIENGEIVSLEASEVFLKNFKKKDMSGILNVNSGETVITLDDQTLEIGSFSGTLKIQNNELVLDGITNSILVDGELQISVNQ